MFIRKQIIPILLCGAQKFAISTEIFFIPSFFITKKTRERDLRPIKCKCKNVETFGDGKMMVVMKISSKSWTMYNFSFCLKRMEIS